MERISVHHRLSESCFFAFPCLSDPARRASLCLKVTLLLVHVVAVGVLLLFDSSLVRHKPWQIGAYLALFIATLFQYLYTSGSSPGFVEDAMRSMTSSQGDASLRGSRDWMELVMDLYPPGYLSRNATCSYCNIVQPPRAKHCHDCDKCVLQFDHHCVWLGTCIGRRNHCRFWWYILEETVLCIWTCVLYFSYLEGKITRSLLEEAVSISFVVILLISLIFLLLLLVFHSYLVLTNQTTYELVRRRRMLYLRGVPERVHPFSKGALRNLIGFCCSCGGGHRMEAVPHRDELEAASAGTCVDGVNCRCCW